MRISVLTLFPEQIEQSLSHSITGRAIEQAKLSLACCQIRDYAINAYGQVDDRVYGGGLGMVLMAEPILQAWFAVHGVDNGFVYPETADSGLAPQQPQAWLRSQGQTAGRTIYLSPKGRVFNQALANELAAEEHLVMICGHYEGVDQRVLDLLEVEEVSLGDFVLTGGEPAAVVMIDAIARLLPGVLPDADAHRLESHAAGLLEEPQYTRPADWRGRRVPEILLSGHHQKIEEFRQNQRLKETWRKRPDLLQNQRLSRDEWRKLIDSWADD